MEKAGWNMWIKHPKELLPFLLLATLHPEADAGGACPAFLPLHKHSTLSKDKDNKDKEENEEKDNDNDDNKEEEDDNNNNGS